MTCLKCSCGKTITRRENKLNAGLCNKCFEQALRVTAREVAKRLGKK